MELVTSIGYVINLILLCVFYMHMFQLNSYFFKKHAHWMKTNWKKILIQFLLILVPTILIVINQQIANIIAIIILGFSIIYNFPKGKAKVKFKVTNRVKRMFITEAILVLLTLLIAGIQNGIEIKLGILCVLSPVICVIANFINKPIEKMRQNHYIKEAKKILEGMPNLTVIGVTGSYGKTSVKNFLEKALSGKYEVLTTPLNYNTTMGVVRTIREKLKPTHQIFICEMGATKPGDIKEICDLVKPKLGIITAIGPQHLESFKSIDNIIKTKFELYDSVKENGGVVFLNYDNEYIAKQEVDMKMFSYGVNNNTFDYNASEMISSSEGLSFKVFDPKTKEKIEFKTKLIGKHNVINLTGAIGVANYLGVQMERIVPRIREIKSVEHRLELHSHGNLTIIDDSYNSNPISSKSAIDTLGEFAGTKIIVTPGLIELGEEEEKYNFELGQYMTKVCDYIFLVGKEHSKPIFEGVLSKKFKEDKIFIVNSPEEAMKQISTLQVQGQVTVLLENDLPDNYNL